LDGERLWKRRSGTHDYVDAFGGSAYVVRLTRGFDVSVRAFDADGRVLWSTRFGTPSYEEVWGIYVDETGVYVSGETSGAFAGQIFGGGQTDAFVRIYALDGRDRGTIQFGTGVAEDAAGTVQMGGAVYLVGTKQPRHRPQHGYIARVEIGSG
jgi:hypothetical protein